MSVTITYKENIFRVPIEEVYPNDYNPNEMPSHLFNELANDVKDEGMDQPVVVVLREILDENGVVKKKYRVVDGEHRYRAHLAAGATEILISLKDWSDRECYIRTIRRNIHGELNPKKFTQLVDKLSKDGLDMETIKKRLAMSDKVFAKAYQGNTVEKAKSAKEVLDSAEKGTQQTFLVANLSQMVRDIVKNFGDNIPAGFICFSYKGQTHLMVSMDAKLMKACQEFKSGVEEDKLDADQISSKLADALRKVV